MISALILVAFFLRSISNRYATTTARFWRNQKRAVGPPLNLCSLRVRVFAVDQPAVRRVERGPRRVAAR